MIVLLTITALLKAFVIPGYSTTRSDFFTTSFSIIFDSCSSSHSIKYILTCTAIFGSNDVFYGNIICDLYQAANSHKFGVLQ